MNKKANTHALTHLCPVPVSPTADGLLPQPVHSSLTFWVSTSAAHDPPLFACVSLSVFSSTPCQSFRAPLNIVYHPTQSIFTTSFLVIEGGFLAVSCPSPSSQPTGGSCTAPSTRVHKRSHARRTAEVRGSGRGPWSSARGRSPATKQGAGGPPQQTLRLPHR